VALSSRVRIVHIGFLLHAVETPSSCLSAKMSVCTCMRVRACVYVHVCTCMCVRACVHVHVCLLPVWTRLMDSKKARDPSSCLHSGTAQYACCVKRRDVEGESEGEELNLTQDLIHLSSHFSQIISAETWDFM
jgi:hypothetical protein